jgi:hypothetical protein
MRWGKRERERERERGESIQTGKFIKWWPREKWTSFPIEKTISIRKAVQGQGDREPVWVVGTQLLFHIHSLRIPLRRRHFKGWWSGPGRYSGQMCSRHKNFNCEDPPSWNVSGCLYSTSPHLFTTSSSMSFSGVSHSPGWKQLLAPLPLAVQPLLFIMFWFIDID